MTAHMRRQHLANSGADLQRYTLAGAMFVTLSLWFALSDASSHATGQTFFAFVLVAGVGALIAFGLVVENGYLGIDLAHPTQLYGLCYLQYYVVPFLVLLFASELPHGNELALALSIAIGYVAWVAGSGIWRRPAGNYTLSMSGAQALALFAMCLGGIALVAYMYAWRISQETFFNQARYFEFETTITDSIRSVFAQQIQIPIILILGLLASGVHAGIANAARRALWVYGLGLSLVLILSSQTRQALTAILFFVIAIMFYRRERLRLLHVAILVASSVAVVFAVQGLRIMRSAEFAEAPNQLQYAIENLVPEAVALVRGSDVGIIGERLISRGGGIITFLSEIMEGVEARGRVFLGQGIMESLYSLVPRFLWEDKPSITAPQIVAQELLSFPVLYDAALSPLAQFYFEGGWMGVVVGYAALGLFMGWLTNLAFRKQSIGLWIALSFTWAQVANVELELVIGVLGVLRNALLVYLCFRFLTVLVKLISPRAGAATAPR